MASNVVYRAYVCSGGSYSDGDPRQGNSNYIPQVTTERLFGDFQTEYELRNTYRKWISSWTKQNPGDNLPTLKIVEVVINENNIDVYYDNS
jgi:hypothetical protein|tara:strand:+ start:576 stop:848 length:273 start_codon:yes stop_codon:yes gene_type:complete